MTVDERQRLAETLYSALKATPHSLVQGNPRDGEVTMIDGNFDLLAAVDAILAALPPPPAGDGERAALIELIAAIDKARDLIPDDDEGLASELFAKYINGASVRAQLVLYPPPMLSAAPPAGQEG